MVKTAVILAAGLGSRLGQKIKDKPKGFLVIDEMPIIEMSICKLIEAGIDKIIMGTGHLKEVYERLAVKYPQIKCVYNKQYQTTESMYTLYNLRDYISDDFILLESDLIYDKVALKILLHHSMPDVILAGELTHSSDEIFLETNKNHFLVNMSKKEEQLKNIDAELVGITKISYPTFKKMCTYAETVFDSNAKLDYERTLVGISKNVDIYVNKLKDFVWCEIDDENHLRRAIQEIYPMIKVRETVKPPIKRNILLNPGPATTTDRVKYAQVVPDICPREKEFGHVMQFVSTELTRLVADPKEYTTILLGGSGTAAIEAILSSVIDQAFILIINNGAYGRRMCQIAAVYGLNYIEYKSPIDNIIDLKALEAVIQDGYRIISHLAIVHNETTTGLLNDIESVGNLCRKHHIQLIVDAVSSFAAIPIDMRRMNISYLAASSNKNIQGMAGVSFVIAHKGKLESAKNVKPRNFYLHLYSQYKYFLETHQMRFTPPVQTLYALKQAIIETKQEGIKERYERYSRAWEVLMKGIARLGLTHLVNKYHHSKIITAIIEPHSMNYDFNEMHDYFYSKGVTIYPGKLEEMNTFRVANIGDITYKDIEYFVELLEQYLKGIGYIK